MAYIETFYLTANFYYWLGEKEKGVDSVTKKCSLLSTRLFRWKQTLISFCTRKLQYKLSNQKENN